MSKLYIGRDLPLSGSCRVTDLNQLKSHFWIVFTCFSIPVERKISRFCGYFFSSARLNYMISAETQQVRQKTPIGEGYSHDGIKSRAAFHCCIMGLVRVRQTLTLKEQRFLLAKTPSMPLTVTDIKKVRGALSKFGLTLL